MNQNEKAKLFASLHIEGNPVVLVNIWDAGTAWAVADAGARAIATGSWSVAAANGYADGQQVPLDIVIANLERIAVAVDRPVTLDFEGGYATDSAGLCGNIARVINAGAVGINFEDQIVGGVGIYPIDEQAARIQDIRSTADDADMPFFINARTDLFLKNKASVHHEHIDEAIERARAYSSAGASGFFAPGLKEAELIRHLCAASPLPVNIMVMADTPSNDDMAALGVARISYGPGPYRKTMENLTAAARQAFGA